MTDTYNNVDMAGAIRRSRIKTRLADAARALDEAADLIQPNDCRNEHAKCVGRAHRVRQLLGELQTLMMKEPMETQ